MDKKIKHLELIQGLILRMSNNSFALKGWTVTLVSAILALAIKDNNKGVINLSYFPLGIFWVLDSYFLSQEKYFRDIYNEVRIKNEDKIDFSMKLKSDKWKLSLWAKSFISLTLIIFYGGIVASILFYYKIVL